MQLPTAVGTQFQFSTRVLAKAARLPAWRDMLGALGKLDVAPVDGDAFAATATVCRLPDLGIVSAATSAMQLSHARDATASDGVLIVATPGGAWSAVLRGRRFDLNPGDGVLLRNDAAWSLLLPSDATFTALRVSLAALPSRMCDRHAAGALPIAGATLALQVLLSYLASALAIEALLAPELSSLAVAHLYHLAAVALGTARDAGRAANGHGARTARLLAIKAEIALRLREPDLTINSIAAAHGVTPRYLQMLFEAEGSTFSEYLLAQRLDRARELLAGLRLADTTIGAIAFGLGFNDLSYFNRTFRRRFGMTPSAVRAGLSATLIAAE
jgi:AraC-like DNA-binding protein